MVSLCMVLLLQRFSNTLELVISSTCISITQIHLNVGYDYSYIPDIDITHSQCTNHLDSVHNALIMYTPLFLDTMLHSCMIVCATVLNFLISIFTGLYLRA